MTTAVSLHIDGDDLSYVLVEVERSFAISLPRDLRHVVTVGDLHREIVARAGPSSGTVCPTSRVFYTVRRHGAAQDVTVDARPDTPLQASNCHSPRKLRRLLAARTGWTMPPLVLSRRGCITMLLSVVAAVVGWATGPGWTAISTLICVLAVLVRVDPGSWSGSWATLGTLSRAVAAANHATLAGEGARHSRVTIWRALATMLADVSAERVAIGPETRLV